MNIIKNLFSWLQRSDSADRVCSTRMINDRFFECKVKRPDPNYCQHSLSSGEGFICNHQDRESFVRK